MRRRPTLIVFVKAPRLGTVKTRLARDIGAHAAWRFYRKNVAALLHRVGRGHPWRTVLAVSPDLFVTRGRFWDRCFERKTQGLGDLGARMARAMSLAGSDPTILVGGDIPGVESRHIRQAFTMLNRADAVFGPAEDGGYWLVGFRESKIARRAFRNVRWSSAHALADTRANLRGLRTATAALLSDVDDGTALARVKRA